MERNPAVGKPAYIITKKWWKKYKEYVHYKDVKRHNKPDHEAEDRHPGPITNEEELCIQDNQSLLKGTGTVEQFDANCVDRYLRSDVSERFDYKVINQELWEFLYSKYGGSEIRRYTISDGSFYTKVETRLKQIPLMLLPVTKLYRGGAEASSLATQVLTV